MKIKRTHIAAGATVAVLGVLAAVAIAAGSPESRPESSSGTQATSPAEVSTITEHRTVDLVAGEGGETAAVSPAPTTSDPGRSVATSARDDADEDDRGRHGDDDDEDRDDDRGRDHDDADDRDGDDHGRDDKDERDDDHDDDDD